MRVYRIEVRDSGKGPFHGLALGRLVEKHTTKKLEDGCTYTVNCPYAGPSIWEDCPGFRSEVDVVGCHSVRQLQVSWFKTPAIRRAMAAKGCRLAIYEVPEEEVLHGFQQVCFDPRKATRIAIKPMPVKEIAA